VANTGEVPIFGQPAPLAVSAAIARLRLRRGARIAAGRWAGAAAGAGLAGAMAGAPGGTLAGMRCSVRRPLEPERARWLAAPGGERHSGHPDASRSAGGPDGDRGRVPAPVSLAPRGVSRNVRRPYAVRRSHRAARWARGRGRDSHRLLTVQTRHTTTAIIVNEAEPLLICDFAQSLEQIAPASHPYRYDPSARAVNLTRHERINGHAHCRALLLPTTACLTVANGRTQLGRCSKCCSWSSTGRRNGRCPASSSVTAMKIRMITPRRERTRPLFRECP
jgi:thiamine phosphate synthase YjbQ (UPF0047 family)